MLASLVALALENVLQIPFLKETASSKSMLEHASTAVLALAHAQTKQSLKHKH